MSKLTPTWIEQNATVEVFEPAPNGQSPRDMPGALKGRINLVRATEIKVAKSPPYLIKGLIHRGDLSVLFGPSGSGKTFLVLRLAHAIAADTKTIFGRRVRPGRVALFALEGVSRLGNRLQAIQTTLGPAPELYVHSEPLLLYRDEEMLKELIEAINDHKADIVIIDTLSRSMGGANENSPEHMTAMIAKFAAIQTQAGAHVMVVHHTGKDEALGARGHSSLKAAADVELKVSKGDNGHHALCVTKSRDTADGQSFGFRLKSVDVGTDDDGDVITSCVVDEIEETPKPTRPPTKITKGDAHALECLREAINEYGTPPPPDLPGGLRVTTKDKWMEMMRKRTAGASSDDALRKAIARAITNLSVAHYITVRDPYIWLRS